MIELVCLVSDQNTEAEYVLGKCKVYDRWYMFKLTFHENSWMNYDSCVLHSN